MCIMPGHSSLVQASGGEWDKSLLFQVRWRCCKVQLLFDDRSKAVLGLFHGSRHADCDWSPHGRRTPQATLTTGTTMSCSS